MISRDRNGSTSGNILFQTRVIADDGRTIVRKNTLFTNRSFFEIYIRTKDMTTDQIIIAGTAMKVNIAVFPDASLKYSFPRTS